MAQTGRATFLGMDSVAVNPDELARLRAIEARLRQELELYGIVQPGEDVKLGQGGVEGLLRHIYGNRDAVFGAKDYTIDILEAQRDLLVEDLVARRVVEGEGEETVRAELSERLRAAARATHGRS